MTLQCVNLGGNRIFHPHSTSCSNAHGWCTGVCLFSSTMRMEGMELSTFSSQKGMPWRLTYQGPPDDISSEKRGICSVQLWFLFSGIWDKLVVLCFAGIWMLFRQMHTIYCATWLQLQLWTKDGEICWRIWSKSFSKNTTHTVTLLRSFWSAYMSTMTLKVLSWNCVNVRRWDLLAVVDQMLGIL